MIASAAYADLRVSFDEGAPKDRILIENTGDCEIAETAIVLDLSAAKGGLIFDVSSGGEGVEVFQPFEIVEGADALSAVPTVVDGQSEVRFDVVSLGPDEAVVITTDLDDTRGQRAITVSGSEIEGAIVTYSRAQASQHAVFSAQAEAVIPLSNC
jgi:hypothetical protein